MKRYHHPFEICPPFARRGRVQESMGQKGGCMSAFINALSELELHANQRPGLELWTPKGIKKCYFSLASKICGERQEISSGINLYLMPVPDVFNLFLISLLIEKCFNSMFVVSLKTPALSRGSANYFSCCVERHEQLSSRRSCVAPFWKPFGSLFSLLPLS